MKYRVVINGKDLGQTDFWQAPTELIAEALEKGIISEEDLSHPQQITPVETNVPMPSQEHVPAAEE